MNTRRLTILAGLTLELGLAILGTGVIAAIWVTPQLVWFSITTAYIAFGVARAAFRGLL